MMLLDQEAFDLLIERAEIHVTKCDDLGLHTTSGILNALIYELESTRNELNKEKGCTEKL